MAFPAPPRIETRRRDLSPGRKRLIAVCQAIGFGEIRNLRVRGDEPSFDPPPEIVRDVVLGREDVPVPARGKADFVLKREHRDLFDRFESDHDLDIERITVQAGLPIRIRLKLAATS